MQIKHKNQTLKVIEIKEHTPSMRTTGWTHFAAVQRPKGTKVYYANLLIVDNEIIHSILVM